MGSKLEELRDAITARLDGLSDFNGVTVLSRKTGDLQNQIESALAQIGACVIVMVPSATPRRYQSNRVYLDPVRVIIRTAENVTINQGETGSKKGALLLAEMVLSQLQQWEPPLDDSAPLIALEDGIRELNVIPLPEEGETSDVHAYDITFTTKLALLPRADA